MTQDEIIPLPQYLNASYEGDDLYTGKQLIEYAKLVAAKEREWVGLTNDELTNLLYDTNLGQQSAVLQAIALLKEKNT
jgi:hypothetical protein